MIHPHNNNHNLESIEVSTKEPFAIGGTRIGRAADRNWLVHWVEEATLVIAPEHAPTAWTPAHVYGRTGDGNGTLCFTLTPSEREAAQWEALEKVTEIEGHSISSKLSTRLKTRSTCSSPTTSTAPRLTAWRQSSPRRANGLIEECQGPQAAIFVVANGPPSTEEPCKMAPRGRR